MLKEVLKIEDFDGSDRCVVEVEGDSILVVRVDGHFYAMRNECTHGSWPLDFGEIVDGAIECELHGGRFCIRTGEAVRMPASDPLENYPVVVEDGTIYLNLVQD